MSNTAIPVRQVNVTRYVTPLREGGSMPAIVEGNDDALYVLKFRGAGQGAKALIAELIGGEIARTLGLRIPGIVFAHLDAAFGRSEGDEEIQDLLKGSVGLNLALEYLSGAFTFDPAVLMPDDLLASQIVWLDSLLLNVDRTARNTNMLWWNKELWLIDHGAALYFHHSWISWEEKAQQPFAHIKDHVLLPRASQLADVDKVYHALLTPARIREITALIPDEWLSANAPFESPDQHREAYARFLESRIAYSPHFVKDVQDARGKTI